MTVDSPILFSTPPSTTHTFKKELGERGDVCGLDLTLGAPVLNGLGYGYLYNWYATVDIRGITSAGWHVPEFLEWDALVAYLSGSDVAGGKLKETGTIHWNTPNTDATNEVGFNAIAAGNRYIDLLTGDGYDSRGVFGDFQTTDEIDEDIGISVYMANDSAEIFMGFFGKYCGMNIRLVKDSTTLSDGQSGTYTGNDGKIYYTICIGNQEWLANNLVETKYRDGSLIPEVTDDTDWQTLITGALCAYENDNLNI
jgi:uncharacterized protein (TIGR02145 family)